MGILKNKVHKFESKHVALLEGYQRSKVKVSKGVYWVGSISQFAQPKLTLKIALGWWIGSALFFSTHRLLVQITSL